MIEGLKLSLKEIKLEHPPIEPQALPTQIWTDYLLENATSISIYDSEFLPNRNV